MTLRDLNTRLQSIDTDLRAVESLPYFDAQHAMLLDLGTTLIAPYRKIRIERLLPAHVQVIIDPPNPLQDPSDRRAALERYALLFDLWPNQMDGRIFYTLWATDMADTNPGRKALAIVNRIKLAREKSRAGFVDMVEGNAREMFRYANAVRTLPQGYHPKPGEACFGGMSISD
jgi:hypothetical protein